MVRVFADFAGLGLGGVSQLCATWREVGSSFLPHGRDLVGGHRPLTFVEVPVVDARPPLACHWAKAQSRYGYRPSLGAVGSRPWGRTSAAGRSAKHVARRVRSPPDDERHDATGLR